MISGTIPEENRISHREVPIRLITDLTELTNRHIPEHEPIVDRTWYRVGEDFTCIVTFRYWDGYQWHEDFTIAELGR